MSKDCILVTGGAGLIGRSLLSRLRADGRGAVGVDLAPKPADEGVERVDVTDIHRLHAIAEQYAIGSIIHCGAVSGPMVMIDNPYGIIQANVVGTANIIELARIRRLRRVVFCSSTSAYGPTTPPENEDGVREDVQLRPSSVYGATKVACEQLIAGYRQQHGLDAVSVRLSWVYGPGRTTDCVVRGMIGDAQAGVPTRLGWGADFPRQFIHVDDAVDALLAAHDAETCPQPVYNATGGTFMTIAEIGEAVSSALGAGDIQTAPGPDPLDDHQHRFDIQAIGRDLGFHPRRTFQDGVRSYADWLSSQPRTRNPEHQK
jgi:nucleoside-diphosphate-sugar epimerase